MRRKKWHHCPHPFVSFVWSFPQFVRHSLSAYFFGPFKNIGKKVGEFRRSILLPPFKSESTWKFDENWTGKGETIGRLLSKGIAEPWKGEASSNVGKNSQWIANGPPGTQTASSWCTFLGWWQWKHWEYNFSTGKLIYYVEIKIKLSQFLIVKGATRRIYDAGIREILDQKYTIKKWKDYCIVKNGNNMREMWERIARKEWLSERILAINNLDWVGWWFRVQSFITKRFSAAIWSYSSISPHSIEKGQHCQNKADQIKCGPSIVIIFVQFLHKFHRPLPFYLFIFEFQRKIALLVNHGAESL